MKSTSVRRVGLSIAVVAALTGVAACSGSDSGKGSGDDGKAAGKAPTRVSPIAALRSVETTTDKADSAKVEATTTMGSMMSMKADGALGWADGLTGNLTI